MSQPAPTNCHTCRTDLDPDAWTITPPDQTAVERNLCPKCGAAVWWLNVKD